MATLTDPDQKQDLNAAESDYNKRFSDKGYVARGLDDLEKHANSSDSGNINSSQGIENQENKQSNSGGFYNNKNLKSSVKGKGKFGKKGGIIGIISALLIGGVGIAGVFGPASMLFSLADNFHIKNDSLSPSMERRFAKLFGKMANDSSGTLCTGNGIKCKMGKLSNSALNKLNKKGVTAIFEDGTEYKNKRTGMPNQGIKEYKIEGRDKPIPASQLKDELLLDKKLAAKILGRSGAFNLRFTAWTSKSMSKIFKNLKVSTNGGVADGKNKPNSKTADSLKKFRDRVPGIDNVNGLKDKLNTKIGSKVSKAGRASVFYTASVVGCLVTKAPKFIAAGVAAYQLAQLLPVASDLVLSPASKAKASAVGSNFTAEDMNTVGQLLTETTPSPNNPDRLTSALDSQYLQAAMGINTSKPKVSEKFTPGYSVLKNPVFKAGSVVEETSEGACNYILSTQAMYTAMAVDMATLAVPGAGWLYKAVSFLGGMAIGVAAGEILPQVLNAAGESLIETIAENDYIKEAKGEELGDVIGLSAMALYSSSSMSSNLSPLSVSQNVAFNEMRNEIENSHKEIEIATLSPFDISSKYTFLGSAVNNLKTSMLSRGLLNNTPKSILSSIVSLPQISLGYLSNKTNAANNEDSYCSYADEFEMKTDKPSTTPAINAVGMPCTGLTTLQASMSTDGAIDLISEWLDESKDFPDDATIEDLVESGYIKSDTPLSDYIEICGNPASGDYLFELTGCIPPSNGSGSKNSTITPTDQCWEDAGKDEDGNPTTICDSDGIQTDSGEDLPELLNASDKQLEAISVFLLDFQLSQAINEGDAVQQTPQQSTINTSTEIGTPDDVKPLNKGWTLKDNTDYSGIECSDGTQDAGTEPTHSIKGFTLRVCSLRGGKVSSLVSKQLKDMFDAAAADGIEMKIVSGFRSEAAQIAVRKSNCKIDWKNQPSSTCYPPTAKPGESQHERGLAIDISYRGHTICHPSSTESCKNSNKAFQWLKTNASKYGYHNLASEAWHWSPSGY